MQAIQQFSTWFSKQKLSGKLAIGCGGLFMLFCLCSITSAIFSPSSSRSAKPDVSSLQTVAVQTALAGINQTGVANAGSTLPPVSTEKPADIATIAPTDTSFPTSTPVPTKTANPNLIKPGTFIVGTDIQPGIYKGGAGAGLFSSCYWERLKDLSGSFDSILANSNSVGQYYIEVKNTDYALKTDCELTRLESIPPHSGDYPQTLSAGTYLVGSDIRPGTYRGQAGSDIGNSCYWERIRNVAGGLDSILANDNGTGQFYIQVLASDFALTTACDLEWVSE